METQPRYFYPGQSQDGQRAGREIAPVRRRKEAVFEVGREKVKIDDEENRQGL